MIPDPGNDIPETAPDNKFTLKERLLLDHIFNNSRSLISFINRDYVYEIVNATFCIAHQGSVSSIVGKTLGELWGEDIFRNEIKNNIDKCFEGKLVRYEASFPIPSEGEKFFEVTFRPFRIASGEITHLIAETYDITDLKLSEKMALEKEEEFRKFETNLPIGFLRCKPDGTIIHFNRAFRVIMGSGDINLHCFSNLRELYAEKNLFDLHLDQLHDGKPKNFGRVTFITCGNNEIVCRVNGFKAIQESGEPAYLDFAFEDSSREYMLENRLLQAQKLETIGALAGGIAHDFNNILATISGYAELIQEDLPKLSPLSDKVSKIFLAVSKARSLTNQILAFSRQMEQEKVKVNVSDVLTETVGFVKSSIPRGIRIKSVIRNTSIPVLADPTQLFRVFLNLLSNAVQAMEDKSGTITIGLEVVESEKVIKDLNKDILADEYALITFRDTGKGMDQSLVRRIFEPFFTTREVGKGSGLGLSVVHGIVSEMGGEILVSSKKNIGSVFYLYIPVAAEDAKIPDLSGSRKKICLISGNKHESHILKLALEGTGYQITESTDRRHLIDTISDTKNSPDLIIFMNDSQNISIHDLTNIFSFCEKKIPCILITDLNQDFMEENLVNLGIIKQQLLKPVSLKELRNAIQLSLR